MNQARIVLRPTQTGYGVSLFFIAAFIAPSAFYSIIPLTFNAAFLYSTAALILVFIIKNWHVLNGAWQTAPALLTLAFVICGIVANVHRTSLSIFNVYMPIAAFVAYRFARATRIRLNVLNGYIILLYALFAVSYYSIIPALIYRPDFDEDLDVFDNSSSNTIPIHLNITLLIYLVLNKLHAEKQNNTIIVFAIVNLLLIVIQQSRMGLVVAIVILTIALADRYHGRVKIAVTTLTLVVAAYFAGSEGEIGAYLSNIGDINMSTALGKDIRGEAQARFFALLDFRRALFGYEQQAYAEAGATVLNYTFNTVLDIVCRYGAVPLLLLLYEIPKRIRAHQQFVIPLVYFAPLLLYWSVESINFPNFWDFFVLIIIYERYASIRPHAATPPEARRHSRRLMRQ